MQRLKNFSVASLDDEAENSNQDNAQESNTTSRAKTKHFNPLTDETYRNELIKILETVGKFNGDPEDKRDLAQDEYADG